MSLDKMVRWAREWLNIDRALAIVIAITGAWTTWYFYRVSLPTRIPTFLVDSRNVLVDGSNPDITIEYKGNPIHQKAVYVVRVYFWNAGNTPIRNKGSASEILDPLTITISKKFEILEAKTLTCSRDLTFIAFDVPYNERNTVRVDFDILEPNDGAALQITYAGPKGSTMSELELKFNGATIGAPEIREVKLTDNSIKNFSGRVVSKYINDIQYLYFIIVLIIVLIALFNRSVLINSNRLIVPYTTSVLILVGYILIVAIPPAVSDEVPSALIVED